MDLIQAKYADFGPTLAHEKLVEADNIPISWESLRKLVIEDELWKPRRKKKESVHPMRERRAWLEERGERCWCSSMMTRGS